MRLFWVLTVLASLTFAPFPAFSGQVTASLFPSQDNTLIENATGAMSCGAGQSFYVGRTNQSSNYLRRGIIKFSLAGIPEGSTIDSVTLWLNVTGVADTSARINDLHAATSDWGEGASVCTGAQGVTSMTNDATWIHTFYDTGFWTAAGGDYDSIVSASTSIGDVGLYSWSGPELTQDVQYWYDNPSENFGWVIIGDESTNRTSKIFASKENSTESLRPVLEVTYSNPVSAVGDIDLRISKVVASPNPSSDRTLVSFTLGQDADLSVSVYNIRGERIAVLKNGQTFSKGPHTVSWNGRSSDGRSVAQGVYFLAFKSPDGIEETVRIIRVR